TPEQAQYELSASKSLLEQRLGRAVRYLAYPYGGPANFRAEWRPLFGQAGHEGVGSGFGGAVGPGGGGRGRPRPAVRPRRGLRVGGAGGLGPLYALKRRLPGGRTDGPFEPSAAPASPKRPPAPCIPAGHTHELVRSAP